jgi:hypothetical protein
LKIRRIVKSFYKKSISIPYFMRFYTKKLATPSNLGY